MRGNKILVADADVAAAAAAAAGTVTAGDTLATLPSTLASTSDSATETKSTVLSKAVRRTTKSATFRKEWRKKKDEEVDDNGNKEEEEEEDDDDNDDDNNKAETRSAGAAELSIAADLISLRRGTTPSSTMTTTMTMTTMTTTTTTAAAAIRIEKRKRRCDGEASAAGRKKAALPSSSSTTITAAVATAMAPAATRVTMAATTRRGKNKAKKSKEKERDKDKKELGMVEASSASTSTSASDATRANGRSENGGSEATPSNGNCGSSSAASVAAGRLSLSSPWRMFGSSKRSGRGGNGGAGGNDNPPNAFKSAMAHYEHLPKKLNVVDATLFVSSTRPGAVGVEETLAGKGTVAATATATATPTPATPTPPATLPSATTKKNELLAMPLKESATMSNSSANSTLNSNANAESNTDADADTNATATSVYCDPAGNSCSAKKTAIFGNVARAAAMYSSSQASRRPGLRQPSAASSAVGLVASSVLAPATTATATVAASASASASAASLAALATYSPSDGGGCDKEVEAEGEGKHRGVGTWTHTRELAAKEAAAYSYSPPASASAYSPTMAPSPSSNSSPPAPPPSPNSSNAGPPHRTEAARLKRMRLDERKGAIVDPMNLFHTRKHRLGSSPGLGSGGSICGGGGGGGSSSDGRGGIGGGCSGRSSPVDFAAPLEKSEGDSNNGGTGTGGKRKRSASDGGAVSCASSVSTVTVRYAPREPGPPALACNSSSSSSNHVLAENTAAAAPAAAAAAPASAIPTANNVALMPHPLDVVVDTIRRTGTRNSDSSFHRVGNRRFRVAVEWNLTSYFNPALDLAGPRHADGVRERTVAELLRSMATCAPPARFLRKVCDDDDDGGGGGDAAKEEKKEDVRVRYELMKREEIVRYVHETFRKAGKVLGFVAENSGFPPSSATTTATTTTTTEMATATTATAMASAASPALSEREKHPTPPIHLPAAPCSRASAAAAPRSLPPYRAVESARPNGGAGGGGGGGDNDDGSVEKKPPPSAARPGALPSVSTVQHVREAAAVTEDDIAAAAAALLSQQRSQPPPLQPAGAGAGGTASIGRRYVRFALDAAGPAAAATSSTVAAAAAAMESPSFRALMRERVFLRADPIVAAAGTGTETGTGTGSNTKPVSKLAGRDAGGMSTSSSSSSSSSSGGDNDVCKDHRTASEKAEDVVCTVRAAVQNHVERQAKIQAIEKHVLALHLGQQRAATAATSAPLSSAPLPAPGVPAHILPTEADVLVVHDAIPANHVGNRRLRVLIECNLRAYLQSTAVRAGGTAKEMSSSSSSSSSSKPLRVHIVEGVVRAVEGCHPLGPSIANARGPAAAGRFLKMSDLRWVVMDPPEIAAMCDRLFRECAQSYRVKPSRWMEATLDLSFVDDSREEVCRMMPAEGDGRAHAQDGIVPPPLHPPPPPPPVAIAGNSAGSAKAGGGGGAEKRGRDFDARAGDGAEEADAEKGEDAETRMTGSPSGDADARASSLQEKLLKTSLDIRSAGTSALTASSSSSSSSKGVTCSRSGVQHLQHEAQRRLLRNRTPAKEVVELVCLKNDDNDVTEVAAADAVARVASAAEEKEKTLAVTVGGGIVSPENTTAAEKFAVHCSSNESKNKGPNLDTKEEEKSCTVVRPGETLAFAAHPDAAVAAAAATLKKVGCVASVGQEGHLRSSGAMLMVQGVSAADGELLGNMCRTDSSNNAAIGGDFVRSGTVSSLEMEAQISAERLSLEELTARARELLHKREILRMQQMQQRQVLEETIRHARQFRNQAQREAETRNRARCLSEILPRDAGALSPSMLGLAMAVQQAAALRQVDGSSIPNRDHLLPLSRKNRVDELLPPEEVPSNNEVDGLDESSVETDRRRKRKRGPRRVSVQSDDDSPRSLAAASNEEMKPNAEEGDALLFSSASDEEMQLRRCLTKRGDRRVSLTKKADPVHIMRPEVKGQFDDCDDEHEDEAMDQQAHISVAPKKPTQGNELLDVIGGMMMMKNQNQIVSYATRS